MTRAPIERTVTTGHADAAEMAEAIVRSENPASFQAGPNQVILGDAL
jgi:hypothetical protein